MNILILFAVLIPLIAGCAIPLLKIQNRKNKNIFMAAVLIIEAICCVVIAVNGCERFTLWEMTGALSVSFAADELTQLFIVFTSILWALVGIFAFEYMKHEQSEDRFYAFFLLSEGSLIGMELASNLVTMYLFYEMLTLAALPLILHSLKKEAISAAYKYLFYSIGGAFLALFGMIVLFIYCDSLDFAAKGTLSEAAFGEHRELILAAVFCAVLGFGTKAGMYPMHGWLPSAHPVAPAPASAVLSAVIAKSGVLAIIRIIYYLVGADKLFGTWVQTALLSLALLTVFMGSMMAYKENIMKKRFAYSTVSQISYVLLGLFFMTSEGVTGGLLHVIFHAVIKTCLFLVAGAIIYLTGKTKVEDLRGIGKQIPITVWCFTLASLGLIGIPPASGFVSKWFLAKASLDSGITVFSWLGPVVLLISALLTAGYLLPITINGFFPGKDYVPEKAITEPKLMYIPLIILAALAVGLGIWSGNLTSWLEALSSAIA